MHKRTLAYFAGLFDGEGIFSIQVRTRNHAGKPSVLLNPRMTMTLKYGKSILDELAALFGGQVYEYSNGMFRWNLSVRSSLVTAASALVPHLKIKREIGKQFLTALALFPKTRKRHLNGERSWDRKRTLAVAKIALNLNPYRKSHRTELYLKELAAIYD